MDNDEIRVRLAAVTETILTDMQAHGWYGVGCERRYDRPTPRDINNGYCEEWVALAAATTGGEPCWLDEFKSTAGWTHCVLRLNGRYYDSIHLDGCRTLRQFVVEAKVAARLAA